jgi:DNA repair protein RadA/Sms
VDQNRLSLLLAVLEKRVGYTFVSQDVFVLVVGGLKITEPAADLAILCAIASSYAKRVIDADTIVIGEVGLTGEVRSVSRIESRLKEAIHMGFKTAIVPKKNGASISTSIKKLIEVVEVSLVEDAIGVVLSRKGRTNTMQTKKVDYVGNSSSPAT